MQQQLLFPLLMMLMCQAADHDIPEILTEHDCLTKAHPSKRVLMFIVNYWQIQLPAIQQAMSSNLREISCELEKLNYTIQAAVLSTSDSFRTICQQFDTYKQITINEWL